MMYYVLQHAPAVHDLNAKREIFRTDNFQMAKEAADNHKRRACENCFVESHTPVYITQTIEEAERAGDAVASVMQRFELEFGEAVRRISLSAQALSHLADNAAPLILRYEDGFFAGETGIQAIANHLGLTPSVALVRDITGQLSPEAIRGDLAFAAA